MTSSACTALLTEHLRCTPLTIIDDIINTTNELLYLSVTAVESYLLKSAPSTLGFQPPPGTIRDTNSDGSESYSETEAEELEKGVHALETLFESAVDRSFDRFEIYVLRNILTVPEDLVPWVRLAHHKNLDFKTLPPPTPDTTSPENTTSATTTTPAAAPPAQEAQTRLRTLRQTLLASHALNQTLRKEVSSNEQTLAQLRLLVSASSGAGGAENPFAFLASPGSLAPATKDAAAFAVSQVDLIRQLVGTLRPKYEAFRAAQEAGVKERDVEMVDAGSDGTAAALTAEEERKRYIERMTRRHMEASRGLRLNARGEVVGGESEDVVVRKGLEEVEALEAVLGRE